MNKELNEELFAKKIKAQLDRSAAPRAGQLARLRAAREQALSRQRTASVLQLLPAGLARPLESAGLGSGLARVLLPIAIVAAAFLGYQQWSDGDSGPVDDPVSEIDAEILKSDLPIDAYLDRGFDNWLKRTDGEDSQQPQQ